MNNEQITITMHCRLTLSQQKKSPNNRKKNALLNLSQVRAFIHFTDGSFG